MGKFVLLREAGGLGDVVRTFPVARGVKERFPGARVEYVALAGYEGIVRLSPDIDAVHTVSARDRRPRDARPDPARHAYLRRFLDTGSPPRHQGRQGSGDPMVSSCLGGEAVRFIDLYCPAFRHEVETEGEVALDRVELFCRAAGVEPSTPHLAVPAAEAEGARTALARAFAKVKHPHLTVGLAPYATHITRSWLGRERLVELARALTQRGCRLVFFHSWKCPRPGRDEAQARDLGAYPALRLRWPALAAHVAECDLVISADTGILHLAGALGVPALGLFGPTSGEIMCRPYPTHQFLQAGAEPSRLPPVDGLTRRETAQCAPAAERLRLSPRERKDGRRRDSATTCSPPCYCRRSRGYSPDVCGRTGCELLGHLTPGDVLHQVLPHLQVDGLTRGETERSAPATEHLRLSQRERKDDSAGTT